MDNVVCVVSLQLLYTGSGLMFGITSKDVLKGEWKEVALPDKNVKVCNVWYIPYVCM